LEKAVFLGERVDAYLAHSGFEAEAEHRFHLTLGRIRSENNLPAMMKIITEDVDEHKFVAFKVDQIQLMESQLTKEGPAYTVLEKFTLNG